MPGAAVGSGDSTDARVVTAGAAMWLAGDAQGTGKPFELNGTDWSGHLHLPHGLRKQPAPPDLEQAAAEQSRALAALDEAELRYAVTFLTEATTPHIRSARIDVIVSALPMTSGGLL